MLPHRIMVDIKEMLWPWTRYARDASDETLLYGVEVKFYSNKVVVNKDFETSIPGLRAHRRRRVRDPRTPAGLRQRTIGGKEYSGEAVK